MENSSARAASQPPEYVFMLYRTCTNIEASSVMYGDETLLWFERMGAARAVFEHTAEEARECLLDSYKIIRRNDNLIFSSGFRWCAALFEFPRRPKEHSVAAKRRLLRSLSGGTDKAASLLSTSLIAHESEQWDPSYSDKAPPEISTVEAEETLEELLDYLWS